ncbi:hypothetical protein BURKHO8Y_170038 [Burkholderia sp. 8Y]|nr:hypothetical protein BURKHO8Y_170038 [Burkholderia sp. 8Y]
MARGRVRKTGGRGFIVRAGLGFVDASDYCRCTLHRHEDDEDDRWLNVSVCPSRCVAEC